MRLRIPSAIKRNAPILLSILASLGTIATSVLSARATPKAIDRLKKAKEENAEELSILDKAVAMAPAYLPSAIVGIGTIICIFGSNALNQQRQATILGAYVALDQAFRNYREAAGDLYGETVDMDICRQVVKNTSGSDEDPEWEDTKSTFSHDRYPRLFERTNEQVFMAAYFLNKGMHTDGYATLNDYYRLLGLPTTENGDMVGWSVDTLVEDWEWPWIDYYHTSEELDDGMECKRITLSPDPSPDFMRNWGDDEPPRGNSSTQLYLMETKRENDA